MTRPNILILYTDQQRGDALGAWGNPHVITPNLDELAGGGTLYRQHFVQHPLCMPSRVSMLSGQYPATLGITDMGVPVPEGLCTLPRIVGGYGYHCANLGKLHFLPHANRDHAVPHPHYGFDQLEIADEPGVYEDAYRAWVRRQEPGAVAALPVGLPPARATWEQLMGGPEAGQPRDDYAAVVPFPLDDGLSHTAFVADRTIDYLQSRAGGQPFLCIAGFYSPHAPLVVPQRFLDLYDRSSLPLPDLEAGLRTGRFSDDHLRMVKHGYYAMVSEVDHHVGRILAALDETGAAADTVVVFTSDHGEWLGDHLRYAKGYPGDDSISRVPLIMRGPGVGAGVVSDAIVEAVDIVPTLLDLAAIPVPPHLQGRSLAAGPTEADHAALMEGTGWKALRTSGHRYLLHGNGSEALWDLTADPAEHNDIACTASPAAALADCRHRLAQRLIEIERPLPPTFPY